MVFAAHAQGAMHYPVLQPSASSAPMYESPAEERASAPSCAEMLGGAARKCIVGMAACTGAPGGRSRKGFFDGVVTDEEYVPGARDRFIVESMPTLKQLERAERRTQQGGVPLVDTLHAEVRQEHMRSTIKSFHSRDRKSQRGHGAGVLRFLMLSADEAKAHGSSVAVDGPLLHEPLLSARSKERKDAKEAAKVAAGRNKALVAELRRVATDDDAVATGGLHNPAPRVKPPHKSSATDWWESNVSEIGSAEDRALRKRAAMMEPAWEGAGKEAGMRMWRIEQFKVVEWPPSKYGTFHEGDAYVLLHTSHATDVEGFETDKLIYKLYFWLGRTTPIDAQGTAAYKTVECDDLLDGQASHHREVMGDESDAFKALFAPTKLSYVAGGAPSGFRKVCDVDLDSFVSRLLRVTKVGSKTVIVEVPCTRESLHHEAAFILDLGTSLFTWAGQRSSVFERGLAKLAMEELEVARAGKATAVGAVDETFWEALGGYGQVAQQAKDAHGPVPQEAHVPPGEGVLYRLAETPRAQTAKEDGAGGEGEGGGSQLSFDEVHRGQLSLNMLLDDSVYVCDPGTELIVWMGKGASDRERRAAMLTATKYLAMHGKPHTTPIKVFANMEDAMKDVSFAQIFAGC